MFATLNHCDILYSTAKRGFFQIIIFVTPFLLLNYIECQGNKLLLVQEYKDKGTYQTRGN